MADQLAVKKTKSRRDRITTHIMHIMQITGTANHRHCKSCEPMKMASSQAGKSLCEKFSSNTKIHFQLASQSPLHGFGRELPKPFFAMLPDLERKSGKLYRRSYRNIKYYFARFVEELKLCQKSSLNWMKETNQNNLCRVEAVDLRERNENSDLFRNMPS